MGRQIKELAQVGDHLYISDPGGTGSVRITDDSDWADGYLVSEDGFGSTLASQFPVRAVEGIGEGVFAYAPSFSFFMTGNVSASANKWGIVLPFACNFFSCNARVLTAPASQSILLDIHQNGTTIFTTQGSRVAIAAAATSGSHVGFPDIFEFAAGDILTFDLDQVGSGTTGANMAVTLIVDPWSPLVS